jgi:indolepyruvate ferredoxin oxidoreductase
MNTARVVNLNRPRLESLDDIVSHRRALLTEYAKGDKLSRRFTERVERISAVESGNLKDSKQLLAKTVARNYAKLLAHKDEFEVARLFTGEEFRRELATNFQGDYKLRFHVAGGPFGKRDKTTGKLQKVEVGPWLQTAFRFLAGCRGLRNTFLDPWRNSDERRLASQLLTDYESDLATIEKSLTAGNYEAAVQLAAWPDAVRGYGHIRQTHADAAMKDRKRLQQAVNNPQASSLRAA